MILQYLQVSPKLAYLDCLLVPLQSGDKREGVLETVVSLSLDET
jgi:hypothetical protein